MSKAIVVSGGVLEEEYVLEVLKANEDAYIIGVDKGLEFLYRHNIKPHYIVGDFDSVDPEIIDYYKNETKIPVRQYSPNKDATDTEKALQLGINLGRKEILILGATGGRIDHLWANIQCLCIALKAGVEAYILDSQNKIRVIDDTCVIKKDEAYGPNLSVFSLTGEIRGLDITGVKWPIQSHSLIPYNSLTVSNEFIGEEATISFRNGILVVMETRDKK